MSWSQLESATLSNHCKPLQLALLFEPASRSTGDAQQTAQYVFFALKVTVSSWSRLILDFACDWSKEMLFALVVQRLDNAIHCIKCYLVDMCRQNILHVRYPLDSETELSVL